MSGTSWTADEDFSVLLRSLHTLDSLLSHESTEVSDSQGIASSNPYILAVITGKGPMKAHYQAEIKKMSWKHVCVCTVWLEAEDYPRLLAMADVGVSLHYSSSGLVRGLTNVSFFVVPHPAARLFCLYVSLAITTINHECMSLVCPLLQDLPMKVVDMFGANLPALAVNFACLDELVQHKKNCLVFGDSEELTSQLHKLVKMRNGQMSEQSAGLPSLATMKDNLRKERSSRDWDVNWDDSVGKLFKI